MRWGCGALLLLLGTGIPCGAQQDGGGGDVRVALFSAEAPRRISVAAAGAGAWWASCVGCRREPLVGTLQLPAVREVVAGGPLTVRDDESNEARTANGGWHLRAARGGTVDVVVTLPSERYVAAVLMGETVAGEPRESLRAMAVVARTFVLRAGAGRAVSGHLASDVCDSTACQAMRLGTVSDAVSDAVRSTAGETLWFGVKRAEVFFSGSCGGITESGGAVWPKLAGVPYLRSIADPYCVRRDRAAWHGEVSLLQIEEIAAREGWHLPQRVISAKVGERTSSERARTVVFSGAGGGRVAVPAAALRLAVGRSLGWDLLRSDAYDLRVRDGVLVFDGRGHGHGVGLCQQGATEMARAGKPFREILQFYFPGTTVRVMRSDQGWTQSTEGGITFVRTGGLTPELVRSAALAWAVATSGFPSRDEVTPTLVLAPTTELFRQLTSQPGWEVASTSGATVVLQPLAVIAANHVSLATTLRHEMLHVAVEASTNAKTPMWLREGMVEVLAGDAVRAAPLLSAADTERLLRSAGSREQSCAAHVAAGARARLLVERYGISAVRGWLLAGSAVPTE